MTVENIEEKTNKNPSDELIQLIDTMVLAYKRTVEERNQQVKAIIDQGRAEGLPDMQIRSLIETALKKHGISDATIRRALPDELKHTQMIRVPKPKPEGKYVNASVKFETTTKPISQPEPVVAPPVYREPDKVVQVLGDKTLEQVTEESKIRSEQQPQKPIPDFKVIKYGTILEAFNQIAFELKQVMDKQRQCKMGLLIFYQ